MAEGLDDLKDAEMKLSSESGERRDESRFFGDLPESEIDIDLVGQIIENRYEILSLVGKGGVGAVYKARHLLLDKIVAIKFLASHLVGEKRVLERFQNEAEITCNIAHPNIVTVREYGISGGRPFLVMDYLEGQSLREIIETIYDGNEKELIRWIMPVLDALLYAHRNGIVHRDIKPANIIVENGKDKAEPKILDFGIAKILELNENNNGITRTGEWFGTPFYMSPEQCYGKETGITSDIYSLGCVLYELIEKKPPFSGNSALEIFMKHANEPVPTINSPGVSKSLKQVIYQCLAKEPANRYQDISALKSDLNAIIDDRPVVPIRNEKQFSKKKVLIISLTATVLAGILAYSMGLTSGISGDRQSNTWQNLERQGMQKRNEGKLKEAVILLEKAYDFAQNEKAEASSRLEILEKIVEAYRSVPDFENVSKFARKYVQLAYQVTEIEKGEDMLVQLVWVEHDMGDYKQAIEDLKTLERSLISSRGTSFPGLISMYSLIGLCNYQLENYELAEKAMLNCIRKYNYINMRGYEAPAGYAYYYLAKIYEKKGDGESVRKYTKLARDCQQEILQSSRRTTIVEKRFLNLKI